MLTAAGRRDDRGSMPLALMVTVVVLGLGVVLATVVSTGQATSRRDADRAAALAAAQSGVDVALSAIRLAVRSDGSGDPRTLPCTTTAAPLAGTVGGGTPGYSVQIYYSLDAPTPGEIPAVRWACGAAATGMPRYALIVATGRTGPSGTARTLSATYTFTTVAVDEKVAGGTIRAFNNATAAAYCFAADTTTPAGRQLVIRACDAADPRQQFAYSAGLTLSLTRITSSTGRRLCLDGGTMAVGVAVTFQPCQDTPVPRQVWGSDDATAFYVMPDPSTRRCMEASAATADATVSLAAMKSATDCPPPGRWTETQTFLTSPETGGGRAGPATEQLVNAAQFGRCIDVTANDVNATFLISFPCKQQLTGAVLWNQRWRQPAIPAGASQADGPIWTVVDGTGNTYCLRSPGTTARPNYYVTMAACDPAGVLPSELIWTVYGDTGNRVTGYRIESSHGAAPGDSFCLAVSDPSAPSPDMWTAWPYLGVSKLVMQTCSDSTLAKWNSDVYTTGAALADITER